MLDLLWYVALCYRIFWAFVFVFSFFFNFGFERAYVWFWVFVFVLWVFSWFCLSFILMFHIFLLFSALFTKAYTTVLFGDR